VRLERLQLVCAHRLPFPVRQQVLEELRARPGLDAVAEGLQPREEVLEDEGEVTALQRQRRCDQLRAAVAHQQLVGLDAHAHALEDVPEGASRAP
jgi:hypothetical protein